jgi:hypothetical protein
MLMVILTAVLVFSDAAGTIEIKQTSVPMTQAECDHILNEEYRPLSVGDSTDLGELVRKEVSCRPVVLATVM